MVSGTKNDSPTPVCWLRKVNSTSSIMNSIGRAAIPQKNSAMNKPLRTPQTILARTVDQRPPFDSELRIMTVGDYKPQAA